MMGKKEPKLSRYLKATFKMLAKARDLYIRSMTECSAHVGHGNLFGIPTAGHASSLPRSFSANSAGSFSAEEDFRELLRAASTRSLVMVNKQVKQDRYSPDGSSSPSSSPSMMRQSSKSKMRRNYSVGIGRIDENKACYSFGDEVFQRSKSYSAAKSASIRK